MPSLELEFHAIQIFAGSLARNSVRRFGSVARDEKHVIVSAKTGMHTLTRDTCEWTEHPPDQIRPDSALRQRYVSGRVGGQVLFEPTGFKRVMLPNLSNKSILNGMHVVGNNKHTLRRGNRGFKRVQDQKSSQRRDDSPFEHTRHESWLV